MEPLDSCPHNDEYECFDCTTRRHAEAHPEPVDGCPSCKLAGIRMYGKFTGMASTSDAMGEWMATGDPKVFDRQDAVAWANRQDRKTRLER